MRNATRPTIWLDIDDTEETAPFHERPRPIVWRIDSMKGPVTKHATLTAALSVAPLTPDAEVRGHGALLALASAHEDERTEWVVTIEGSRLIDIEFTIPPTPPRWHARVIGTVIDLTQCWLRRAMVSMAVSE